MINDNFVTKCRSLDPSAAIDREKNRKIIKARLLEEENVVINKNKKIRRPAIAAAVLAGILSISVVAYAAAPMVWRHFDTQVIQGEEFLEDFWMAEIDMPDGTTSIGGSHRIDREALEAAGGGVVIVEVEGEEHVLLDELHFDSIEDGLALLEIENPLIPDYLPEGFAFSRFTFPVNPNNHQFMMGTVYAARNAFIYYCNGDSTIRLHMIYFGSETGLKASYDFGQQPLIINGNKAVLSGALTAEEVASLKGVTLYDSSTSWGEYAASLGSVPAPGYEAQRSIMIMSDGILYSIRSDAITLYDLVKMAASMK